MVSKTENFLKVRQLVYTTSTFDKNKTGPRLTPVVETRQELMDEMTSSLLSLLECLTSQDLRKFSSRSK